MNSLEFTKSIFKKAPLTISVIGGLYLFAGILELISLAALLPVILDLLNSESDSGLAGQLLSDIGFSNLSLPYALALVLGLMSFRGVFLFFADYRVAKLARSLEIDIRYDLYHTLMHSNWTYLLSLDKGKIPNVILREASNYAGAIQKLGQFSAAGLIAIILIFSSLLVSWQAFLIFFAAVIPYIAVTRLANVRIKKNARSRISEANKIGNHIGEGSIHLKYIKAAGLEPYAEKGFTQSIKNFAHYYMRIILYKSFIKNFPEVFGVIILGVLVFYSKTYIGDNSTDIIFFLLLLFRGYRQLANVESHLSSLLELIPSYEICHDTVSDTKTHQEDFKNTAPCPDKFHSIEVKNISFTYSQENKKALKNLSLNIPENGVIALAGGSGAGKTTLGDIILGLMRPQNGSIVINDSIELSSINLREWRQQIGYVPQDAFLITGSIRENILLGAKDQSDENLLNAACSAHIHTYIESLEKGYDTQVGDLGIRFSGGQKQRIALARCIAKEPKMLILDEATSALDNLTEHDIQKAIYDISSTIPVIVIAHRLSTIKEADNIYMMKDGTIVEEGTYKTLMDKKGSFWKLNKITDYT